jgi:hypothetical protein
MGCKRCGEETSGVADGLCNQCVDAEWAHENLKCRGCFYCDERRLNMRPCCTFPGKLAVNEDGTGCSARREVDDA